MGKMDYLKNKPIAVLGGGASGRTHAADCALAGRKVRMFEFPEFEQYLGSIKDDKKIEISGEEVNCYGFKRNGIGELEKVTTDIKEAIEGAGLIVISLPAVAFDRLSDLLVPCLEDGQVIHYMAGNFGSLILRKKMREQGCTKKVIIGEWSSQPYGTRIKFLGGKGMPECGVLYRAVTLRGCALPSTDNEEFFESVKYLPSMDSVRHLVEGDTVVDIGLSNVNPVLHCPGTILGVGAMENWGLIYGENKYDFAIYSHAYCPSISEVQYSFYLEQCKIAEALGTEMQKYEKEEFFSRSNVLGQEFMGEGMIVPFEEQFDLFKGTGPFDMNNRYMTEDIPVGCSIQYQLAKKFGVQTPVIESMITLASVMRNTDYYREGWKLEDLSIAHMDKQQLLKYLHEGIYTEK